MPFALPVHEKGTAKVQLAAAAADQPVQVEGNVGLNAIADIYTVPAGKRLLIEYVQGYVSYRSTEPQPGIQLLTSVAGTVLSWSLYTPFENAAATGYRNFGGESRVAIYADPGTAVRLHLGSLGTAGDTQGFAVFSGLLQAAP